ncbi:MAG: hypothetical protein P794_04250 [Epsilonproteobacteria bacterium (ex Lamellibrachia satsuma)]|nr:MAG: hypothetical protein P794_04250 [Epsilonproteobacteria bacterium (ex Lamellibrachia satsuma)]
MKILIIKFRHIGDVLLSTALIRNLKLHFPDASIDMAVNEETKAMIEHNPDIDQLFLYPRNKIKNSSVLGKVLLETAYTKKILSNHYDLVINLTEGDRGALISLLSRAKTRLGIQTKNYFINLFSPFTRTIQKQPIVHTVERDLEFLKLLELTPLEKKVQLFSSESAKEKINTILSKNKIKDFIIIHPVSRWMFKCWDDEKFAHVIDYIELTLKKKVVITASPDPIELNKVESILQNCKSTPLNLSGLLSLDELSALIAKASLFVGADTAPMHMAAALDIPIIALFGPSNPVLWGPWDNETQKSEYTNIRALQTNGKHIVIQHPDDEIIYHNGRKISTAMMKITTAEVIEQINKKI